MRRTGEVAAFINEREAVRLRKSILEDYQSTGSFQLSELGRLAWGGAAEPGDPNSWSLDYLTYWDILHNYRFCNVRREDDRVTRWIREHIIVPYWDHEFLPIMLAAARTINWPDTLKELMQAWGAWPFGDQFDWGVMANVMQARKDAGQKVYTGAYMIRAESHPEKPWFTWSKQRYIAGRVIGELWETRHDWQHLTGQPDSQGVWEYLQMFTGWGPFMAYQVVVDLQHTKWLQDCPEKQTWACAGPGTLRGLSRWTSQWPARTTPQAKALELLTELRADLNKPGMIWDHLQPIDLSDVCNVMCEFDKYERVRLHEGKPRATYVPGRGY